MKSRTTNKFKGIKPDPENLIRNANIDFSLLGEIVGQSVVSVNQFSREMVGTLCKLAALLESKKLELADALKGNIIITAFFEPSTRTRLSFESAALRQEAKIISIPEGARNTGVAKGESLSDIGEMFNAYGDLVVLRHTETDAIAAIGENLRIPLVNAGNGSGEHPTQALADWYAILKWKPTILNEELPESEKINLGILGSPGSMRAVNSFLRMALLFKDNIQKITIVSELADPLGDELNKLLSEAGIPWLCTHDMEGTVEELDVIYMNSIAFLGDSYKAMDSNFKLHAGSPLKEDAIILHPLARLGELDHSLDDSRHNLYFDQAHGAVFVRQALYMAVLDRVKDIGDRINVVKENELELQTV
ncbi:aspartate/ornithine carbamoyltransferase family protein [Sphingobacterium paucimobilis]|uniref:Uncharacterized protein n=1 Tax=Sphingobacterium paucimobilis HER1398 TaxID=1346330 RepID=U2HQ10_9SPHI|nr:hypothetical protein [Sphingobacterium paucimobilis]ERJ57380.1 hypothetical protein M472_01235 [Sphingobacterium paucimobilis HER1398]